MNVKETLTQLCTLEAQIAVLGDQRDELRRSLLVTAMDQYDEEGAAPTWRTGLGTVGLTVPKPKPAVNDTARFEEFLEGRYGEEAFETVRRVKTEAFDALVNECSWAESVCALVTPDGEPVPGVTIQARAPYLFVKLSKEARLAAQVDLDTSDPTAAFVADMGDEVAR